MCWMCFNVYCVSTRYSPARHNCNSSLSLFAVKFCIEGTAALRVRISVFHISPSVEILSRALRGPCALKKYLSRLLTVRRLHFETSVFVVVRVTLAFYTAQPVFANESLFSFLAFFQDVSCLYLTPWPVSASELYRPSDRRS
jgi:hypothetical protein